MIKNLHLLRFLIYPIQIKDILDIFSKKEHKTTSPKPSPYPPQKARSGPCALNLYIYKGYFIL